jgi:protein gp37
MNKSKIEWTNYTWNPITGCSNGCSYCYARKMAENPFYAKAFPFEFEPHFYPDRLNEVARAKIGAKIFACSMGELFGDNQDWTERVLRMIRLHPELTFQLLTKRPENLIRWSPFPWNCWVGVSVTNAEQYIDSVSDIAKVEAKVKFISFEPLLEQINGGECDEERRLDSIDEFDWIIIGQQTPVSPKTAPKVEWIREIVKAADKAKIPVFLKENLRPLLFQNYTLPVWARKKGSLTISRQEFPGQKRKEDLAKRNKEGRENERN